MSGASSTCFLSISSGLYGAIRGAKTAAKKRNATTNPPDHVKEFSFTGSGGSYSKLFDNTLKVLSWDNIVWINRSVLLP